MDNQESEVRCLDLGVPWSRERVQWGQFAFDLAHSSRLRRLWQIDRTQTVLSIPLSEISAEDGRSFDVTISPRDKDGAFLGPDQKIGLARRPALGKFVGPMRFDPVTGNYIRTYERPFQQEGADVEFRVLVNEELDDTRPVVHLRGRPKILALTPDGVGRAAGWTTIRMSGSDFTESPSVRSSDSSLRVYSSRLVEPGKIEVGARAPASARIGWSGLQVVPGDGRPGPVAPVFVHDPARLSLSAQDSVGDGRATLAWFGDPNPLTVFSLERSSSATFEVKSDLYRGPGRTFEDIIEPNGIWFFRVS
jgi:hypothetical protein